MPDTAQSQNWGSQEGDLLFLLVLFIILTGDLEVGTLPWGRDTQAEMEKATPHFSYTLMMVTLQRCIPEEPVAPWQVVEGSGSIPKEKGEELSPSHLCLRAEL